MNKKEVRINYNPDLDIQVTGVVRTSEGFSLDISNASDEKLDSIVIELELLDLSNNYLEKDPSLLFSAKNINLEGGNKKEIGPFSLNTNLEEIGAIIIRIDSYSYRENEIIKTDRNSELSFGFPIFEESYRVKLRERLGKEVVVYGQHYNKNWRCVCGFINNLTDDSCIYCQREKEFVLNNLNKISVEKLLGINEVKKVDREIQEFKANKEIEEVEVGEEKPRSRSRLGLAGLTLVLIVGLLLGTKVFINKRTYNNKIANADKMVEEGNYKNALSIYEEIYQVKPSDELDKKMDDTLRLLKSEENFNKGLDFVKNGNYLEALKHFEMIEKDDKTNYEKSLSHYKIIEEETVHRIKTLINEDKTSEAVDMINEYLLIMPDSLLVGELKNEVHKRKELEIEEAKAEAEKVKAEAEKAKEEAEEAKKNLKKEESLKAMQKLANTLNYSYQVIVPAEANIRRGPSIDSGVITVVPSGSEVYIYDTIIEGSERIWCDAEIYNYFTGEFYYGWVSSKVLGY